jgi:hypothetical protein
MTDVTGILPEATRHVHEDSARGKDSSATTAYGALTGIHALMATRPRMADRRGVERRVERHIEESLGTLAVGGGQPMEQMTRQDPAVLAGAPIERASDA